MKKNTGHIDTAKRKAISNTAIRVGKRMEGGNLGPSVDRITLRTYNATWQLNG